MQNSDFIGTFSIRLAWDAYAASTATMTGIGIQSISERLKAISATVKFTSDEQGEHTIITC